MSKLTLQEIENILNKKTFYHVVYEDENGKEVRQVREDAQKAFQLYNRENVFSKTKGRLEEVRPDGTICVFRGYGEVPIMEHAKDVGHIKEKQKTYGNPIQALLGDMTIDEYRDCLKTFARIHGTTLEKWGIDI